MIELDVRDDADLGPQSLDRAVGLVPFDDEPALPRAGVPVQLADPARLKSMSAAMRSMARPEAADEIAEELIRLAAAGG